MECTYNYTYEQFVYVQVPSFTGLFQAGSNSSGCPHVFHYAESKTDTQSQV